MIGENAGPFKFWGDLRGLLNIISISEAKFTLATFHSPPRRHFNHPVVIMNFTLFGSSKAADEGLSTLFNYSPSPLFQKDQASDWPPETRFFHTKMKPLTAKYLTVADAFSSLRSTAAFKTTLSFT